MSQNQNTSMHPNIISALSQLQDEVTKVEQALLELRYKKQQVLQYQLSNGIESLSACADKINALADSLEREIINFKEIAVGVNKLYHTVKQSPDFQTIGQGKYTKLGLKITNIEEMANFSVSVPTVIQSESQFLLTVKTIDLYQNKQLQRSLGQTTKSSSFQGTLENRNIKKIGIQISQSA